MRLVSLGRLRLDGEKFRREKPLLLLAYLALEGPKPRRFLAGLFWPGAPNSMNNLAVALAHLRRLHAAEGDDSHLWITAGCDVLEVREHLRAGQLEEALALYHGPFADSLGQDETGPELEEWVLETREGLARELRAALLWEAEAAAGRSQFGAAARGAERAYRLPGCPPPEEEELPRFYRLLRAAEHPLAAAVEREARELGVPLGAPAQTVRGHLRPLFLGRQAELGRLAALGAGEWAWVRGGPGMGKSALLGELARRLGARVLPARSGLPYATLEPLLGDVSGSETALLRRLCALQTPLLLDDWDSIDPESQGLLRRLHPLRPGFAVVLTGTGEPPVAPTLRCELLALTHADLTPADLTPADLTPADLNGADGISAGVGSDLAGLLDSTGGLPSLVGALLRGETLEGALDARLQRLSGTQRRLYLALALLPDSNLPAPSLSVVRQALTLDAAALVAAHEGLMTAGLALASGAVRSAEVARRGLEAEPTLARQLALALARCLPTDAALPLYQRSRPIWEDSDLRRVQQAYSQWAGELLRRGFPKKAVELLEGGPPSPGLTLLRAQALERSSQFRQALEVLDELPVTPDTQALRSRLLFKLGRPAEAQQAAEAALGGSLEAEAEALNTLGELALSRGQGQDAAALFSRAATLWRATGQTSRWLWALNNRAVARSTLEGSIEESFQEVLEASGDDLSVQASVLTNMGNSYAARQQPELAIQSYRRAVALGSESGALIPATLAWNGLGAILHTSDPPQARGAYQQGLKLCAQTGDAQLTAILLANLAELDSDIPAWQQAIDLLDRAGFQTLAQDFRDDLKTFMAR